MAKDTLEYHRLELSIASDPLDPRRILPTISSRHRRILDVGCGVGQTLIASNLPETAFAVGVDLDHSALAYGVEHTDGIHFVRAKGEALPFFEDSFELVICRVALPYMHVSRALDEMSRVLTEGGELWLVLHPFSMTAGELSDSIRAGNLKAAVYRLWVLGNGFTLRLLGKQWSWPLDPGRYESWQTVAGTKRTLLKAGFDDITIDRGTHFLITARKG
jgi:ubiquinone/menaquinone biosynthesis C-methylase UbiE